MLTHGLLVVALAVRQNQAFLASPSTRHQLTTSLYLAGGDREKFNPFASMMGDVASSLLGGGGSSGVDADPSFLSSFQELGTPWGAIRSRLEEMQTPEERAFRDNIKLGYGTGSPLNLVRLYDESNSEDDIRVVFYRDHASWCPYCQKVWMMLEEKKIPYRVEKINMSCYGEKPSSFFSIQPGGQIPVARIDGKVYGQSNDIIYALEELFPESKSLRPEDGPRAQQLLRLERTIFGAWMYWLRGRDPRDRQTFIQVLGDVESALSNGPFFMGKKVSMVDFMFAPFLERMAASLLFFKGFQMRVASGASTDFPNLNKWFDAMEGLESYQLTKSDYYTHCWDLPPQLGGCTYESTGEPYEKAINGDRLVDGSRGSWELPLVPDNGGVEPDWKWCCSEEADAKKEAVERVTANYNAIVAFAARGAGRKGMPPFSAPLADPNAVSNEAVQQGVQASLQVVCMALLEGTDKHDMQPVAKAMATKPDYAEGVVDSLAYLRDRVGVPRDMRLPAARQLRAHLNWAIAAIEEAS